MASPLIVCSSHSDPAVILSPCLVVLTLPAVDLLHVIEIVLELIQETVGESGCLSPNFSLQSEGDKFHCVYFSDIMSLSDQILLMVCSTFEELSNENTPAATPIKRKSYTVDSCNEKSFFPSNKLHVWRPLEEADRRGCLYFRVTCFHGAKTNEKNNKFENSS